MTRILIVDDHRETTDTFAILLKLWGHETRKAYDGESVLQQALAFLPHVILLDIGLPGMDGYAVATRIRGYQKLANVKIIAISGYVNREDIERGAKTGFFDQYLPKPLETARLKSYLTDLDAE